MTNDSKPRRRKTTQRKRSYRVGDTVEIVGPARVRIGDNGRLIVTKIRADELGKLRLDGHSDE